MDGKCVSTAGPEGQNEKKMRCEGIQVEREEGEDGPTRHAAAR